MSKPRGFEIRFFGIMAIIVAGVIMMYGATFREDIQVVVTLLLGTTFLVMGLTFGVLMTGIKFKFWDMSIIQTGVWTGMCIGAILVVNKLVPISFDVSSPISQQWLGVYVAIGEECFFRLFLCGVASIWSEPSAIVGSSVVWSAYHVARYGGRLEIYPIIFLVGLFLGWAYLKSRFGDPVMFAHAGVNWYVLRGQ